MKHPNHHNNIDDVLPILNCLMILHMRKFAKYKTILQTCGCNKWEMGSELIVEFSFCKTQNKET
jgi:hypothetical protein